MHTLSSEKESWSFHAEGMSCIKCIRKIQHLAQDFTSLEHVRIDLGTKKITAQSSLKSFDPESFIAKLKEHGFNLKLISKHDHTNFNKQSNKSLAEMGIAGFCAGNIMLFSAAEYVGAGSETWFKLFPILSGILFLPVLFYSAQSFYQNAYFALRAKKMSIDTPIVLAILGGAVISYFNLFTVNPEVYFDSITMFIFLLLASRYLIFKIQTRYLSPIKVQDVYSDEWVQKLEGAEILKVPLESLSVGDKIQVQKNQFVPVDGELLSDEALINDAFYSGEFLPKVKTKLDVIFAGSKNLSAQLILRVQKTAQETRLAQIVDKLNDSLSQKTKLTTLADRGANYFVTFVVALSILVLSYFAFFDLHEGLNRVMALLIVACPCGLAIVIPLLQTLALKKGLKNAILIKDPNILENLSQIQAVFFDKTGTLTRGEIQILKSEPEILSDTEKALIYNLEKSSEHPIAKALIKWVGEHEPLKLEGFSETLGKGVSASYEDHFYELKSCKDANMSSIGFYKNEFLLAKIIFEDALSEGSQDLLSYLNNRKIETYILSGDLKAHALKVAEILKINPKNVFAELSPENKRDIVKSFKYPTLYIGDGVNDSLSMTESSVAVSMESSANVAFKSSGAHILSEGLQGLKSLFELSETYLKSIRIVIAVSFVYNFIFAIFAMLGFVGPLIAIFIMPLSSISLTLLALYLMEDRAGLNAVTDLAVVEHTNLQGLNV